MGRTARDKPRGSSNSSRRYSTKQAGAETSFWAPKSRGFNIDTGPYGPYWTGEVPLQPQSAWSAVCSIESFCSALYSKLYDVIGLAFERFS